jgi:hypothetical protein
MSPAAAWLAAEWPAPAAVRAGTTLRGAPGIGASAAPFHHLNLGAHCGDDPAAVAGNRARVRALLSLPQEPRWLRQVHGTGVWRVDAARSAADADDPDDRVEADAAVTSAPGEVLAILTADCLPVLFCARDGSEIGAAHAGWRGLAAGALEATVDAMRTPPDRLLAWLVGPRPDRRPTKSALKYAMLSSPPTTGRTPRSRRHVPATGTSTCSRWHAAAWRAPVWSRCTAAACAPCPIRVASIRTGATDAAGAWRA